MGPNDKDDKDNPWETVDRLNSTSNAYRESDGAYRHQGDPIDSLGQVTYETGRNWGEEK